MESDIVIFENQLNAVDQRIQDLQKGQKGGGPRDRYYSTQGIQELQENQYNNPNFQQPYPYSYGQQQMYPTLNPGIMNPRTMNPGVMNPRLINPYMNMNPYGQQQMINPLQQHTYAKQMSYLNKTLELESKLAFYVNVELVLFPGASVSPLQKASALCGSRLGDIRKAVSDLFGFEYYQKPIDDAYIYQRHQKNIFEKLTFTQCVNNYIKAVNDGLLKVMSKLGISVISSYRGGLNFSGLGLSRALVAEYFPGMYSKMVLFQPMPERFQESKH